MVIQNNAWVDARSRRGVKMEQIRNEWVSENGKYKILARKYGDQTSLVSCFIKKDKDKYRVARNKDLPKYVLNKINEMRKEVEK